MWGTIFRRNEQASGRSHVSTHEECPVRYDAHLKSDGMWKHRSIVDKKPKVGQHKFKEASFVMPNENCLSQGSKDIQQIWLF